MLNETALTLQQAQQILKSYDCNNTKPTDSPANQSLLRQALLLVTHACDYQILGICADTTEAGILALETYSKALGYQPNLNLAAIEGAVYIKFNPKTGLCYIDAYAGSHRGVLVSCQSYQEEGINEMYGHLPLNLF